MRPSAAAKAFIAFDVACESGRQTAVIVVLTAEAETDLETIAEYIARDSVTTALTVVHELREKCLALADSTPHAAMR